MGHPSRPTADGEQHVRTERQAGAEEPPDEWIEDGDQRWDARRPEGANFGHDRSVSCAWFRCPWQRRSNSTATRTRARRHGCDRFPWLAVTFRSADAFPPQMNSPDDVTD